MKTNLGTKLETRLLVVYMHGTHKRCLHWANHVVQRRLEPPFRSLPVSPLFNIPKPDQDNSAMLQDVENPVSVKSIDIDFYTELSCFHI